MKIAIVRPSVLAVSDFSPSAIRSGIPGAEETALNLLKAFRMLGAETSMYTQTEYCGFDDELGCTWKPISHLNSDMFYDAVLVWTDHPPDIQSLLDVLPQTRKRIVRLVNQASQEQIEWVAKYFDLLLVQSEWYSSKFHS